MSETNTEDAKELKLGNDPKPEIEEDPPSSEQEEERIKEKYGGLLRKKHPLISKTGLWESKEQRSKGPLEKLRPKLQPTPHQQARSRRSAYAPSDDSEGDSHEGCSHSKDGQENAQDDSSDNDDHLENVPKEKDHLEDAPKEEDHPEDKNSQG